MAVLQRSKHCPNGHSKKGGKCEEPEVCCHGEETDTNEMILRLNLTTISRSGERERR